MWKDRNLDRHGHDEAEQAERLRQRHLREISVWYELKDSGALSLSAAEKQIFYSSFQEHEHKEGTARLANMWLCSFRSVLQLCQKRKKSIQTEEENDCVSIASDSRSADGGSVTEDEEPDGVG